MMMMVMMMMMMMMMIMMMMMMMSATCKPVAGSSSVSGVLGQHAKKGYTSKGKTKRDWGKVGEPVSKVNSRLNLSFCVVSL